MFVLGVVLVFIIINSRFWNALTDLQLITFLTSVRRVFGCAKNVRNV